MLALVRDRLRITWQDPILDRELDRLVDESKAALEQVTGTTLNWEDPAVLELLLNRIRYAYNNALEYFESAFGSELLRLQLLEGVKLREGQEADPEAG